MSYPYPEHFREAEQPQRGDIEHVRSLIDNCRFEDLTELLITGVVQDLPASLTTTEAAILNRALAPHGLVLVEDREWFCVPVDEVINHEDAS